MALSLGQKRWAYNIVHAFFSAGAAAFGVSVIAPNDVGTHALKVLEVACVLGVFGVWRFFADARNPYLPDDTPAPAANPGVHP